MVMAQQRLGDGWPWGEQMGGQVGGQLGGQVGEQVCADGVGMSRAPVLSCSCLRVAHIQLAA